MIQELKYDNPMDLSAQKINEIIFGIEWFEKPENQKLYKAEQFKISKNK